MFSYNRTHAHCIFEKKLKYFKKFPQITINILVYFSSAFTVCSFLNKMGSYCNMLVLLVLHLAFMSLNSL